MIFRIFVLGMLSMIQPIHSSFIFESSRKILSSEEEHCLAEIIYSEAGNQSFEGKVAVAYIVFNRKLDNRFPKDCCSVISQPRQFTKIIYKRKNKRAHVESILAAKSFYLVEDPTKKGLYFHEVKKGRDWKRKKYHSIKIQNHLFYR